MRERVLAALDTAAASGYRMVALAQCLDSPLSPEPGTLRSAVVTASDGCAGAPSSSAAAGVGWEAAKAFGDTRSATLLCVFCFEDPIRQGSAAAVAECLAAGVHVAMITGDHVDAAATIARKAGLPAESVVHCGQAEALAFASSPTSHRNVPSYPSGSPGARLM